MGDELNKTIQVRVSQADQERVYRMCKRSGRSISALIRLCLLLTPENDVRLGNVTGES